MIKIGRYRIELLKIRKIQKKIPAGFHNIRIVAPCGHVRSYSLRTNRWHIKYCVGCRTEKNFPSLERDKRFWYGKDMKWRMVP